MPSDSAIDSGQLRAHESGCTGGVNVLRGDLARRSIAEAVQISSMDTKLIRSRVW